jgi:aminoglycoside phosphotransferase (APT) family kinase protein
MDAWLAQPYQGEYQLIHGDICPGNLLASTHGQICGLLDFGIFTMYGDPLFDAATAWLFFDMYDELQANVRARLLPFVLERYGTASYGRLIRYVLLYSLLSANTYAPDCSDGHYAWCVRNLNTEAYWTQIE